MKYDLLRDVKGTFIFGLTVITIFLLGGGAWAIYAPLAGSVIAEGVIGFESKRKTVQHLEGGIIKKILVSEGDHVEAGETIMVLDDTAARAHAEELRNRIRTLAGEEARLQAERARKPVISFSHPLLQFPDDPEVAAIREQQQSHFSARANNLETRRSILNKRIDQLRKEEEGFRMQRKGVRTQLRLINEELKVVEDLVEKGWERKPRLLAILRAEAQLVATEGELVATIARSEAAVGETQMRIINLETDLLEDIDARLTEVQAGRVSAEKLYRDTMDRLSRTMLISPIEGVILDVRFKTVGGVITPGERIFDIVPVRDELIVNTRIRPVDIDEVTIGSAASVLFSAFQQRYIKRVNGNVIYVSPDAFVDETTGERYFIADIEIDRAHLVEVAPDLQLTAGMPAEVFIVSAERTFARYLIEPIRRSFGRAFREG